MTDVLPVLAGSTPSTRSEGFVLPTQLSSAARLLVDLCSGVSRWQHRRVEQVALEGSGAKRSIAVDVDVSSAEHQVPLPIAFFAKDEVPVNVNAQDEESRALALLTRDEAATVGYVAMQLAIAALGSRLTAEEDQLLFELATEAGRPATAARDRLRALGPTWLRDRGVNTLIDLLTEHSVLFVLLDGRRDGRRVVRVAWEEIIRGGGLRTVGAGLLGLSGRLLVTFHSFPAAQSSHFEVTAPHGTAIRDAVGFRPGEEIGVKSLAGSRAHLYAADDHVYLPQRVLIGLSADGPPLRAAIGAVCLLLLALAAAATFPVFSDDDPALLALLSLPIAILLREAASLRGRDAGFAGTFSFGPVLVTLILALAVSGFLVAGSDVGMNTSLPIAAGLSLVWQMVLVRNLTGAFFSSRRIGRRRVASGREELVGSRRPQ